MQNHCPLCGAGSLHAFTKTVLGNHKARFELCPDCGLLYAVELDWLPRAYEHPIAAIDTGIMKRNLLNAARVTVLIGLLYDRNARFLDCAGGYGVFVRLMRDLGFDFYWDDKYCQNLLTKGFEGGENGNFQLVTAMEAIEHVVDPHQFIDELLTKGGNPDAILLTTTTFNGEPPPLDWSYYAFESGQHIRFYQARTLAYLAARHGLNYVGSGDFHLLSRRPVPKWKLALAASKSSLLLFPLFRLGLASLTQRDFHQLSRCYHQTGSD